MTLRMGLVGAGPWAGGFHAPMLAAGPGTMLAAVWARRREAAADLARTHGCAVAETFEELLELCDAVAFAVPPDVQADLAPRAAAAGKHLLLEKPLAFTLADAERIVAAVEAAGVQTVLMLRNRFTEGARTFVSTVQQADPRGAQASFVTGAALPGSFFATPWRVERGALFDLGPHVLDLLDAALGPIEEVRAAGDPLRWLSLTAEHRNGALSQIALSITTPGVDGAMRAEAYTEQGLVSFDGRGTDADTGVSKALAAALATAVETGEPFPLDARRGLELQRLIDSAGSALGAQ